MKKKYTVIIGYFLTLMCFILELIFCTLFKDGIYAKFPMTFANLGGFMLLITTYYKYKSDK
jgi:hypothetical protein